MVKYQLDSSTPVAVIGAGTMGAGVAQVAAQAGHSVRIFDVTAGAAEGAINRIAKDLGGAVERGKMSAADRDAILGRLSPTMDMSELAGCGLAVEAIIEKLEPKQELFKQLEAVLGTEAVLATNTSSISITAIAQPLDHPARVVGWHFFNPATRMKLVEIIPGLATDPELIPAMHALSAAWGKTSVDAPNRPGFIVNRVARPYYAEALRLLEEGIADAATIDLLMREAGGFAMGPFELMDLIGVEVNLSVTTSVWEATGYDPRFTPSVIQQELARAGRYGRKSGVGFHDYREGAEKPEILGIPLADQIPRLTIGQDPGVMTPLVNRLSEAGVKLARDEKAWNHALTLDGVPVMFSDGKSAASWHCPVILLDLARDYSAAKLIGVTASYRAKTLLSPLSAALGTAGIKLVELRDSPGLVVMRIVACIINEAADLITWAGVSAESIDVAMKLATSYPLGPMEWAQELGPGNVLGVLSYMEAHYGDPRYRRSPVLTRWSDQRGFADG